MRRVVLTGCSGGGKSTLLAELAARGFATVAEPGRRVIAAEHASGGNGFPWEDGERFADLAFWMAVGDHAAAEAEPTFFDRSALDQAAWYLRTGRMVPGDIPDYERDIFVAPPWREIFVTDQDRRHGFEAALMEYADLMRRLPAWGYRCHFLPKTSVARRADWVLARLGLHEVAQ